MLQVNYLQKIYLRGVDHLPDGWVYFNVAMRGAVHCLVSGLAFFGQRPSRLLGGLCRVARDVAVVRGWGQWLTAAIGSAALARLCGIIVLAARDRLAERLVRGCQAGPASWEGLRKLNAQDV